MLHDVPPWDRPSIVAELARLLRPGGRLFSREPTAAKHGMPAAQAREVYAAAGLSESLATEGKLPLIGEYYRAVWTRPAGLTSGAAGELRQPRPAPAAGVVREKAGGTAAGLPDLHLSGARQRPLLTPDQVSL